MPLFLDIYSKEELIKRQLPTCQRILKRDLVVNEKPEFFFSTLFTFLNEKVELQSHGTLLFRPNFEANINRVRISVTQITIRYLFDDEGIEQEVTLELTVMITSKQNLSVRFRRTGGNDFYY